MQHQSLALTNELTKELTKLPTNQVTKVVPTLNHINPGHPHPLSKAHFFKKQFNIKLSYTPKSSKFFAFFRFQKRIPYINFFLVPSRVIFLDQLIILYPITLIIRTSVPSIKTTFTKYPTLTQTLHKRK